MRRNFDLLNWIALVMISGFLFRNSQLHYFAAFKLITLAALSVNFSAKVDIKLSHFLGLKLASPLLCALSLLLPILIGLGSTLFLVWIMRFKFNPNHQWLTASQVWLFMEVLSGAICEEVAWRGYLFSALPKSSFAPAIIALLWLPWHFIWPNSPLVWSISGIAISYLLYAFRSLSGSILPGILFHTSWNFLVYGGATFEMGSPMTALLTVLVSFWVWFLYNPIACLFKATAAEHGFDAQY